MVRWYGGWDSYMVASAFDLPIYAPRMGRMKPEEATIDDITHIPYVTWHQWVRLLSQFKYAVHLMPTVAAGTFALNCAYYGIPCIGNAEVDTQYYCFPDISSQIGDIKSAVYHVELLKDEDFYDNVSKEAKQVYHDTFRIEKWKQIFFDNMETILNSGS